MIDNVSEEFKILFVGWIKNPTSDKIWGIISINENEKYYTFWGRRGSKLRFNEETYPKLVNNNFRSRNAPLISPGFKYPQYFIQEKMKKGYKDYTNKIHDLHDNFKNYLFLELFNAKILNKVKSKRS